MGGRAVSHLLNQWWFVVALLVAYILVGLLVLPPAIHYGRKLCQWYARWVVRWWPVS